MERLLIFAAVGLAAQLVDGALGMAYGVTSTTLLLSSGVAPAIASASVHLAEVGTSFVSGLSHWRFGNVDWQVVSRIALPGAVGGFLGATVLSNISTDAAVPWMAVLLLLLGIYIITRFIFSQPPVIKIGQRPGTAVLAPLGLFAGFVDATGGGGWGPVATPTLIASGKLDPRKVIGSVSASEFAVTIATSLGFLFGLGTAGLDWRVVVGLLGGGVVAAPFAAYLVRKVSLPVLGALVGSIILVTNSRTLMRTWDVENPVAYVALAGLAATLLTIAIRKTKDLRGKDLAASLPDDVVRIV